MKYNLTKNEIRQFFKKDPAFLWYQETMRDKFNVDKLLLASQTSDRLWQVKGINEVLYYITNPDILLDLLDEEDMPETDQ